MTKYAKAANAAAAEKMVRVAESMVLAGSGFRVQGLVKTGCLFFTEP
jgi:hypothetical protein